MFKNISTVNHCKVAVKFFLTCMLFMFIAPGIAFAQLATVSSTLGKIQSALTALSVITVTIAVLYVGYKVLFGGSTFKEMSPVIIGAIVIAGAAEIASLLVG